jgi:hypothetical protein
MHNRLNNNQTSPTCGIANKFSSFPTWNFAKILERVYELRRGDHVLLYVNQACCGSVNLTTGIARKLSVKASSSELLKIHIIFSGSDTRAQRDGQKDRQDNMTFIRGILLCFVKNC